MTSRCGLRISARLVLRLAFAAALAAVPSAQRAGTPHGSCFLLYEIGVGEVRRNPAASCATRVTPQSTFKVPHAIAALDAGVIADADAAITYDGRTVDFDTWRRNHTLATAMRYSVLWYFQELAKKLGAARERAYLEKLRYGNRDASSGLTTFWLGGSLRISAEEQQQFVLDLFGGRLPVAPRSTEIVRRILVQPHGTITNAAGEHRFARPWPQGIVLSAKTGSGPTRDGSAVRWLIGHVQRGPRSWVFVSNVIGAPDLPALAAVEQAERALIAERVLR
jgi:beta-lactamase class D